MLQRILVVDDDARFRRVTTAALTAAGYEFDVAGDADTAIEKVRAAEEGAFDAVLLDVDLPDAPGWAVIESIRSGGNHVPVLFVTGKESVDDRVKGLRLGADDYLVKPIAYEELVARLEAVLRRHSTVPEMEFGDVRLDLGRRKVDRNGTLVDLSPKEFDLLAALVQARGEVVDRETLLRDVWDIDFDPGTNVIDVHIGRLRKKLDRHGNPLIETVRGKGYRVVAHEPERVER